jgi:glyoxylase-like metal-dependent hydrolase (beta-lactamase superfamily II)
VILRQLFDRETCTYTYLVGDPATKEAAVIDSVVEQVDRDAQLVKDLGLKLVLALDTHVHADHISGMARLKERTGCRIGLSARSGARGADLLLKEGDRLAVGKIPIQILETPGHTNSCLTYHIDDAIFTGDALLIRGCGRTDFQEGDAGRLYDSVTRKLFSLSDATRVFPAHDYNGMGQSTVGEEKRLNPRLTKPRAEFIELMRNLKLEHPKKIAIAVPANLRCGAQE